jgi:hypothetical protein
MKLVLHKLTKLFFFLSLLSTVHAYNDSWDLGRVKTFKGVTAEANVEAVNLVNALAKINAASIANNCGGITIDDINAVGTGEVNVFAPFLVNYQAGICNRNGIANQAILEEVIAQANIDSAPLLINPPNIEGNIHIPNAIVGQQYTYDIADNVWSGLGELTTTTTIEPEGCFNINGNRVSGIPNAPAVCTVTHTVRNIANAEVSTNFIITIIPDPVQVALDKLNACAIANDCSQITVNDILATGVDADLVHEVFLDSYRTALRLLNGVQTSDDSLSVINNINNNFAARNNSKTYIVGKQRFSHGTLTPPWTEIFSGNFTNDNQALQSLTFNVIDTQGARSAATDNLTFQDGVFRFQGPRNEREYNFIIEATDPIGRTARAKIEFRVFIKPVDTCLQTNTGNFDNMKYICGINKVATIDEIREIDPRGICHDPFGRFAPTTLAMRTYDRLGKRVGSWDYYERMLGWRTQPEDRFEGGNYHYVCKLN